MQDASSSQPLQRIVYPPNYKDPERKKNPAVAARLNDLNVAQGVAPLPAAQNDVVAAVEGGKDAKAEAKDIDMPEASSKAKAHAEAKDIDLNDCAMRYKADGTAYLTKKCALKVKTAAPGSKAEGKQALQEDQGDPASRESRQNRKIGFHFWQISLKIF